MADDKVRHQESGDRTRSEDDPTHGLGIMCGILGGTSPAYGFNTAVESLSHRGPDSSRVVPNQDLTLGFTRLAVIDPHPRADQPMASPDGKVWIVFNGEIYGYKRLRNELVTLGCQFATASDTEVILYAYLTWGDDFIHRIDGMFAIAIHDLRLRQLKLFRDRIGIKPLFYFFNGKEFAFSSELKGIVHLCRDENLTHDETAIFDFLTYTYIPEPKTLYENVFKLPPAHLLVFNLADKSIVETRRYWRLEVPADTRETNVRDAGDELRVVLRESVQDQLVADVPVGCFLSGGIDSSIVVAVAASLKAELETFTIGFEDATYDEVPYAKKIAKHFQTKENCKTLSKVEANEMLEKLKSWYDEPFADTSAFATYLVSRFARQQVTVVLTGDGGDEVFGGYRRFDQFRILAKFPRWENVRIKDLLSRMRYRTPYRSRLNKFVSGLEMTFSNPLSSYGLIMGDFPLHKKCQYARELGIPGDYEPFWYFKKYYREDLPPLTRMQYLDLHTYLPSDVLTKVDRSSMAVSLEARVPLLSTKIVELMFSLPEHVRYHENSLKGLLKYAYQDEFPRDYFKRRKMGFTVPSHYLLRGSENIQEKILKEVFQIV